MKIRTLWLFVLAICFTGFLSAQSTSNPQEESAREPMKLFFTVDAAVSPHPQWSYGFRIGTLRKWGWNVSMMSNFGFQCFSATKAAEDERLVLYQKKSTRLGVTAGAVWHPTPWVLVFLNAGYGYRGVCYRRLSDNNYYLYGPHTVQGVELSTGMMLNAKGMLISIEAATVNFKYAEFKFGIGGIFKIKD